MTDNTTTAAEIEKTTDKAPETTSGGQQSSGSANVGLIIGIIVGALAVVCIIVAVILKLKKKK